MDEAGLRTLRSSLEADGYELRVDEVGDRVDVRIVAGPDACPDCLVPEPVLRGILGQTLGVPERSIDLSYPEDH